MLFNSYAYLIFLPVVALVYFNAPARFKRLWLLAASMFFYGCWSVKYLFLMLFSIALTYACARVIAAVDASGASPDAKRRRRKGALISSLVINLAILFFFKYFNFVAASIASLLRREAAFIDVLLPVGISFYTFQALGYTIDVYRGDVAAERNFIKYAAFVCFFPQLVAGPIERAANLLPQFDEPHKFKPDSMRDGLMLIGWGFFQKLVIADRAAIYVNAAFGAYEQAGGLPLALAAFLFAIQIYCDFSSYSNIARGSAQILGFKLMRNFSSPYLSASLAEFWNRWHISLSTWFRDYVYIPLGGNRKGLARAALNILIIFFLSGLWHGANFTFIVWGMAHGLGRAIGALTKSRRAALRERLGLELSRVYRLLQTAGVFAFAALAFVFFRADTVAQGCAVLQRIFTDFSLSGDLLAFGLDGADMAVCAVSVALLAAVDALTKRGIDLRAGLASLPLAARWSIYLAGIALIAVLGVYGPAYDSAPFIYFQF